jgi:D-beta-D-heptose 7-phosphate kinase/D-beta-D-heptose 1-phosphate adenosyltransferase
MELLKYCKSLGTVVVGLNSDESVRRLKGPTRPFFSTEDRKVMLEGCRYVDRIEVFDEDTPYELIKKVVPDIIVKGGDYTEDEVVGNDLATVRIFQSLEGYSTTSILENM